MGTIMSINPRISATSKEAGAAKDRDPEDLAPALPATMIAKETKAWARTELFSFPTPRHYMKKNSPLTKMYNCTSK